MTLAISDVPRDDPSAIASGPTVPDPTTLADARALVAKYDLKLDEAISRALNDPANESCKPGDAAFARAHFELIARPRNSLDAAIKLAKDAGYEIVDLGADLEGEARNVAADHARLALKARADGRQLAILSGGELTVTVRGQGPRRPQSGIRTGAGRPAQGHDAAFRRWPEIPTAPTAAPAVRPIRRAR